MLRNLAIACRRAYTCTCAPRRLTEPTPVTVGAQQWLHSSLVFSTLDKDVRDRKEIIRRSVEVKYDKVEEEDLYSISAKGITIPTPETASMIVDGVRYDELPIVLIKASLNNTIMTMTTYKGEHMYTTSCGKEGFYNVKKSSSVAAQATGLAMGQNAVKQGVTSVRIIVKGLGQGRLASIKGIESAGVNIVSITDNTPIPHNGPRPRKAKRQ